MDVQPGHCWRCEKPLPDSFVPCEVCGIAKYCKTSCKRNDRVRHECVECQMFGPKTCTTCGRKAPDVKKCAGCYATWYCNKQCQTSNWKVHKPSCHGTRDMVRKLSKMLSLRNSTADQITRLADLPHYFGNIIAVDFLRLSNNEWSDAEPTDEQVTRDYHILSVGCGDLRNTVLTAGSLPAEYQGNLHVTLNDFDPFVMARNVLFLYMMARFRETEGFASSLTTIWYSLELPQREYDLVKTSLGELTQMTAQDLIKATHGLVTVSDEDMKYMGQVWSRWHSLECLREKNTSLNLRQQRRRLFENGIVQEGVYVYLNSLSPQDRKHMTEWFDHALFLPHAKVKRSEVPFDNPTLTGRAEEMVIYQMEPKSYSFLYCINAASHPFMAWDCLQVRACTSSSTSPMVMYHAYVTNLLQKACQLTSQCRLHIHISLVNCFDFPHSHRELNMSNYDRIFTSNIADYFGIARLLQTFKPLLNRDNRFSAIVTETMNWITMIPSAHLENVEGTPEFFKCISAHVADTHRRATGFNDYREYHNDTIPFLLYLQADIMAGGYGKPPLKDIPSPTTVMNYHGMKMHDFRKGPNRLVPFKYRVNARNLSMMNGIDRALEWRLQDSENQAV